MNWYLEVLRKYAVFDGRARRKEYWMFALFNIIIILALGLVEGLLGIGDLGGSGYGPLSLIYSLGIILPSVGVAIRRLHDTGRSGWWLLITLIPILGGLVVLVFMILDSQPGSNQYGPNPKGVGA